MPEHHDLHVALANNLAVTQWDWAGAEREYRRAIDANPNLADREGVTPLAHARKRGYTAMSDAIAKAGGR